MTKDPQIITLENTYNLKLKIGRDYDISENHWLPRKFGIQYLAFGKTLYCNKEISNIPDHEFLHLAQFNKYGIARVIAHYLYYFIINYFNCFDLTQSFANIPFEVEARAYEKKRQEMQ